MEAVIADLDKDMTIEIASGVSHLNFTIERMRDDSVLSKCSKLPLEQSINDSPADLGQNHAPSEKSTFYRP